MAQTILNAPVSVSFDTFPCEYRIAPAHYAEDGDVGLARYAKVNRPLSQTVRLDPWSIREEFLSLRRVRDLTAFLNKTGTFDSSSSSFLDLAIWQGLLGKMLVTNPQRWPQLHSRYGANKVRSVLRASNLYTRFVWNEGRPSCAIRATTTLAAMVASIHVDHLRGARFRFCKRPDCGQPYEVTSKHQRLYCSQYCAHFQSLRRLREKKKRERRGEE